MDKDLELKDIKHIISRRRKDFLVIFTTLKRDAPFLPFFQVLFFTDF